MAAHRIVIVGGGFAGVTLAQRLERLTRNDVEITLVSAENHLVFSPLLAEAVGRSVSLFHVVVPGRQMVRRTHWLTARVTDIDLAGRTVHYGNRRGEVEVLPFDQLVFACGATVNLDALPGLAAHAYPFKTLGDAVFLSNDLIGRLEEAAAEGDPAARRKLQTVVVIGGGFSGVELCGQVAELSARAKRYYPRLAGDPMRVVLLQRGDRLLPELNAVSLSEFARTKLEARGIEVRLGAGVEEVGASGVRLQSGERIEAATIVSTVGTMTNPLLSRLSLPLERGRVQTQPDMQVVGIAGAWAIGDCAAVPNAADGRLSPPTAQFATRQAAQLASNLVRTIRGEITRPFKYRPAGILASLGHRNAVAEIFGLKLSGFPAWFLWRGIYLAKTPSWARKIELAGDWFWSMFFPPNVVQLQMARTEPVGRAHYGAGELVAREGTPVTRLSLIEAGTANCHRLDATDAFATLVPGEFFGEAAFLARDAVASHAFTVRAATPLDVVTLHPKSFGKLPLSPRIFMKELERTHIERQTCQTIVQWIETVPGLARLTIGDVMSSPADTLAPHQTLAEVVEAFHGGRPGYPVADDRGALCGYCGRDDLYDAFRRMLPPSTPCDQFMRADVPSVAADQALSAAAVALTGQRIEVLPVLSSDGRRTVIGVLSPIDLFRTITAAAGVA